MMPDVYACPSPVNSAQPASAPRRAELEEVLPGGCRTGDGAEGTDRDQRAAPLQGVRSRRTSFRVDRPSESLVTLVPAVQTPLLDQRPSDGRPATSGN